MRKVCNKIERPLTKAVGGRKSAVSSPERPLTEPPADTPPTIARPEALAAAYASYHCTPASTVIAVVQSIRTCLGLVNVNGYLVHTSRSEALLLTGLGCTVIFFMW